MPDREKVIKGLEIQLDNLQKYADATELLTLTQEHAKEILALLKEQEENIKNLRQTAQSMMEGICLLKEQEAVKRSSRRGTNGLSIIWTCGKCGADLEPNNAKAKYCSNCGQAVKWK